jgi:hypothetical protein
LEDYYGLNTAFLDQTPPAGEKSPTGCDGTFGPNILGDISIGSEPADPSTSDAQQSPASPGPLEGSPRIPSKRDGQQFTPEQRDFFRKLHSSEGNTNAAGKNASPLSGKPNGVPPTRRQQSSSAQSTRAGNPRVNSAGGEVDATVQQAHSEHGQKTSFWYHGQSVYFRRKELPPPGPKTTTPYATGPDGIGRKQQQGDEHACAGQ